MLEEFIVYAQALSEPQLGTPSTRNAPAGSCDENCGNVLEHDR